MGQRTSRPQGAMTLGHLLDTLQLEAESNTDRVFLYPEWYALAQPHMPDMLPPSPEFSHRSGSIALPLSSPSHVVCHFGRTDSGYGSSEEDAASDRLLAKDLAYIDATYYRGSQRRQHAPPRNGSCSSSRSGGIRDSSSHGDVQATTRFTFAQMAQLASASSIRELCLSRQSLVSLHPNISHLTMVRKLDLSYNQLTRLPEAIGCLRHLEVLVVAHNKIATLPETIGCLSKLTELDASHNQLVHVHYLGPLTRLRTLNLSHNRLTALPAEVSQLPHVRRFMLDHCPLQHDKVYALKHNSPSLKEWCARTITRHHQITKQRLPSINTLPRHLITYLQSANVCIACHQPFFDAYVTRGRLVEKADRLLIPVEYRLCSAHWSDDDDRILSMFSMPSTLQPARHSKASAMAFVMDNSAISEEEEEEDPKQASTGWLTSPRLARVMTRKTSALLGRAQLRSFH